MSSPITPLTPAQTTAQEQRAGQEGYVHRVLVAGDIFLNVLRGGPEDVTISTSAALASQHGNHIGRIVSEMLDFFQKNHGAKAAAGDEERAANAENLIGDGQILNVP